MSKRKCPTCGDPITRDESYCSLRCKFKVTPPKPIGTAEQEKSRLLGSAQLNSENGSAAEKDGGSSRGPKDSHNITEAAPAEAIQDLVGKRHKKGCPCRINDRNLDICDSNCPNCTCEPKPESPQAAQSTERTYEQWRMFPEVRRLFAGYSPSITGLMEQVARMAWTARGEK